jgi:hypothetical protein
MDKYPADGNAAWQYLFSCISVFRAFYNKADRHYFDGFHIDALACGNQFEKIFCIGDIV